MKITKTPFEGLLIVEPSVFPDSRGFFYESYHEKRYQELGIATRFFQDNQSSSTRNVIRGLHFQNFPHAQTKLVRCILGTILDVAVDLRKDEPTFKKAFVFELSAENKLQLLIPKGFAHGFSVLSDKAEILYKCDEYYHPESSGGIYYNDPALNIDWKITNQDALVSDNDRKLPLLSQASFSF
jgi:dTDP-4-dehydrorhamnose 3,5-epimerase